MIEYIQYCCIYLVTVVKYRTSGMMNDENQTRVLKPGGRSTERTGWEGERVDRLCTERHPGTWHNGGLENDGVKG